MFKDDKGNISSMRVMMFVVVTVYMIGWLICSVKAGTLQPISWPEATGGIGLFLSKALQKAWENDG